MLALLLAGLAASSIPLLPAAQVPTQRAPLPALSARAVEPGARLTRGSEWTLELTLHVPDACEVLEVVGVEPVATQRGGPPLALGTGCTPPPFTSARDRRDKEIVVALHSTFFELRLMRLSNGQLSQITSVDLPERIEAIDIDDSDNDGLNDIVIGLAGESSPSHVRVFRYDAATFSLVQEFVSGDLEMHVEDLEIGDADNDGRNEIVVGLERTSTTPVGTLGRVLLFEYEQGAWVGPVNVAAPEDLSVQDLDIGDVDQDGENEIVVVFANTSGGAPGRQIRVYDHSGGQWLRRDVTPMVTTGTNMAERLLVTDFDGVPGNEFVASLFATHSAGELVHYVFQNPGWSATTIDSTVGLVAGLAEGDYDGDGDVELVCATNSFTNQARVRYWEFAAGAWSASTDVSPTYPGTILYDAEVADADDDFCAEVLAPVLDTLHVYEFPGLAPVASHTFIERIDSAQVGDVDNDQPLPLTGCGAAGAGTCASPFVLRVEAPPGTSWDVAARAKLRVRSRPGGPTLLVEVESPPTRVEVVR